MYVHREAVCSAAGLVELDEKRAEPWFSAGPRLGAFLGVTNSSNDHCPLLRWDRKAVREPRPTFEDEDDDEYEDDTTY